MGEISRKQLHITRLVRNGRLQQRATFILGVAATDTT